MPHSPSGVWKCSAVTALRPAAAHDGSGEADGAAAGEAAACGARGCRKEEAAGARRDRRQARRRQSGLGVLDGLARTAVHVHMASSKLVTPNAQADT